MESRIKRRKRRASVQASHFYARHAAPTERRRRTEASLGAWSVSEAWSISEAGAVSALGAAIMFVLWIVVR